MKKVALLFVLTLSVLSCNNEGSLNPIDNNSNEGGWKEYRANKNNTGFSNSFAPKDIPTSQEIEFRVSINEYFQGAPIVNKGVLYSTTFVPWTGPDNYYFKAFDLNKGNELWSFQTSDEEEYFSNPSMGNGIIYIGARNGLYALDAESGQELWYYSTGPEDGNPSVNSPAINNGLVYIEANNVIYALDGISGEKIWELDSKSLIGEVNYASFLSEKLTVSNNIVFTSISGVTKDYHGFNSLYALNASNGEVLWKYSCETSAFSLTASSNENIYFLSSANSGNKSFCYAINVKNGLEKWKTEIDWFSAPESGPALGYGLVFVPTYNGSLYCLDEVTGDIKWKVNTGGGGVQSNSPIVANEMVLIGGVDGNLHSFDVYTGEEKWTTGNQYGSYNFGGPIIANGMVIYENNGWLNVLK